MINATRLEKVPLITSAQKETVNDTPIMLYR